MSEEDLNQFEKETKYARLVGGKGFKVLKQLPTKKGERAYFQVIPDEGEELAQDPILKEYEETLNTALSHGIFFETHPDYEPDSALLRCEFIFELWKQMGSPSVKDNLVSEEDLNYSSSEIAYYREAVRYFLSLSENALGLYSWQDIQRPITIAEIGYILYYILGTEFPVEIGDLDLNRYNVSIILKEDDDAAQKKLETRLEKYKNHQYVDNFLQDIREVIRYIPLPLYHAFESVKTDFNKVQEGGVPDDWVLREITKEEAQVVLDALITEK